MNKLAMLLSTCILMLPVFAVAEIEKTAIPGEKSLRLLWWPKVVPPPGWHFDEGSSKFFAFNAIAPDGSTFSDAETVMYAKAIFKPKTTDKTVSELIENDVARTVAANPGIDAKRDGFVTTGDGKRLDVVTFSPASSGNWERVAYGEEGEFYLVFTVSSRSKTGLAASVSAFDSMVAAYREKAGRLKPSHK